MLKHSFGEDPLISDCWEDGPQIICSVCQDPQGAGKGRAKSALEERKAKSLVATGIANSVTVANETMGPTCELLKGKIVTSH